MYKFKGQTKHFKIGSRFPNFKWVTFKDGDLVSKDLVKDVEKQGGNVEFKEEFVKPAEPKRLMESKKPKEVKKEVKKTIKKSKKK